MSGFTNIPNDVLRDPDLSLSAKVLYGVLQSGQVDTTDSQAIRAAAADMGKGTFYEAITCLKERDLVRVERWRVGRIWRVRYTATGVRT